MKYLGNGRYLTPEGKNVNGPKLFSEMNIAPMTNNELYQAGLITENELLIANRTFDHIKEIQQNS